MDRSAHWRAKRTNTEGELVLVMDSPSWAARVRYSIERLPSARVRIKVVPRGG